MRLTWLVIALIFQVFGIVRAYDVPERVREMFAHRAVTPVEGAWLWSSGALVTIESDAHGNLTLTLVDSPDALIDTPQVIGSGHFGGTPATYVLELKTRGDAETRMMSERTAKFTARLSDGRLTLTPYSSGYKVNIRRLVPYLFRFSVTKDKEPAGIDGAIRVWPTVGSPEFPVTL